MKTLWPYLALLAFWIYKGITSHNHAAIFFAGAFASAMLTVIVVELTTNRK